MNRLSNTDMAKLAMTRLPKLPDMSHMNDSIRERQEELHGFSNIMYHQLIKQIQLFE